MPRRDRAGGPKFALHFVRPRRSSCGWLIVLSAVGLGSPAGAGTIASGPAEMLAGSSTEPAPGAPSSLVPVAPPDAADSPGIVLECDPSESSEQDPAIIGLRATDIRSWMWREKRAAPPMCDTGSPAMCLESGELVLPLSRVSSVDGL